MAREVEFEELSTPPNTDGLWEEVVDQDKIEEIHSGFAEMLAEAESRVDDTDQECAPRHGEGGIWNELGRTGLAASMLVSVNVHRAIAKVCRIDSSGIV